MRIVPPVFPWRGLRTIDAWGAGGFGSPRDDGSRRHMGLDFLGLPGDKIVASIGGRIGQLGFMYADSAEMRNVHIIGMSDFANYAALVGYVVGSVRSDAIVSAGDEIGVLQDVAGYWKARQPTHLGEMHNHCHLGLRVDGTWVDPSKYLPHDLPQC